MFNIGVVDTTFSRVDMFRFVEKVIDDVNNIHNKENNNDSGNKRNNNKSNNKHNNNSAYAIERYTVPGIKDIPVACKILFEKYNVDICIALGMPGPKRIDKQCGHEASIGMQQCMLMAGKHILEVFVHMDEAFVDGKLDKKKLYKICLDRTVKHTRNAVSLLEGKTSLSKYAGHGKRQGHKDAGPIAFRQKRN